MFKDVVIRETPTSKPKTIGRFSASTNVFETERDITKHLLRNKNAWALDYKLLKELLLKTNSKIVIIDNKNRVKYVTTSYTFVEYGLEIEYLSHRKQICLNLEYFMQEDL